MCATAVPPRRSAGWRGRGFADTSRDMEKKPALAAQIPDDGGTHLCEANRYAGRPDQTMGLVMSRKDIAVVVRAARCRGLIYSQGRKHGRLTDPATGKFVTVSNTPSCRDAHKALIATVRRYLGIDLRSAAANDARITQQRGRAA